MSQVALTTVGLTVSVCATALATACPICGQFATRIHSRYQRRIADLPCAGQRVQLHLHVRKFFCDSLTCPRKIFTERLSPFIEPWARLTTRLCQAVEALGLATCGELGARLGKRLGIQTSPTTILRRVMAMPTPAPLAVSALGIDDFALLRGRRYGTILVDLSRHQVIDLLPDRQAETATAWMEQHPEIELVSRDRGGDYASAATAGAPQASQCADRFHILSNLGEALEGVLVRRLAAHRRGAAERSRGTPLAAAHAKQPPKRTPKAAELSRAKREERLACYQQAVALRKQGCSQTAIASQVGIGHATVSRWLRSDTFPEQPPRRRMMALDPHLPFLRARWEAGCHNIAQLYRELVARGYPHSYASVYDQLARLLPEGKKNAAQGRDLAPTLLSARKATFLFLRRLEDLDADEQATLLLLRHLHPEVGLAGNLVQQFAQMLRTRTGEQLDAWLEHARASEIRELQGFAAGVERDKAAVLAGLTRSESNAQTEGQVNKLKLIKRMMFGRAGFPLLRQRLLHTI